MGGNKVLKWRQLWPPGMISCHLPAPHRRRKSETRLGLDIQHYGKQQNVLQRCLPPNPGGHLATPPTCNLLPRERLGFDSLVSYGSF